MTHSVTAHIMHPITWFLVADGNTAKVYTRKRSEKTVPMAATDRPPYSVVIHTTDLIPVPGMAWQATPVSDYELGKNRLGRVFESASAARHMSEPHDNVHERVKKNLMHTVAQALNEAKVKARFHRLVLVAPAKMLGEIKTHLEPGVLNAITKSVAKDLAHLDPAQLAQHLEKI